MIVFPRRSARPEQRRHLHLDELDEHRIHEAIFIGDVEAANSWVLIGALEATPDDVLVAALGHDDQICPIDQGLGQRRVYAGAIRSCCSNLEVRATAVDLRCGRAPQPCLTAYKEHSSGMVSHVPSSSSRLSTSERGTPWR